MTLEPMNRRRRSRLAKTRIALSACVVLFAVNNMALTPLEYLLGRADLEVLFFPCVGLIGAQAGLHAIWCVLAPVGAVKRLATGIGAGLLLYGAWALGYAVEVWNWRDADAYHWWEEVASTLLCLPLLVVAVQVPLWVARWWFGWRILRRCGPSRRLPRTPIGIRDILVATGVVALVLSIARSPLPGEASNGSPPGNLIPLVTGALVAAAISLFTTLPVVVATLRARRLWLAIPTILFLDLAVMSGLVVISSAQDGRWPQQEECLFLILMLVGFSLSLIGPMLIVRRLGFRLYWGRR